MIMVDALNVLDRSAASPQASIGSSPVWGLRYLYPTARSILPSCMRTSIESGAFTPLTHGAAQAGLGDAGVGKARNPKADEAQHQKSHRPFSAGWGSI